METKVLSQNDVLKNIANDAMRELSYLPVAVKTIRKYYANLCEKSEDENEQKEIEKAFSAKVENEIKAYKADTKNGTLLVTTNNKDENGNELDNVQIIGTVVSDTESKIYFGVPFEMDTPTKIARSVNYWLIYREKAVADSLAGVKRAKLQMFDNQIKEIRAAMPTVKKYAGTAALKALEKQIAEINEQRAKYL